MVYDHIHQKLIEAVWTWDGEEVYMLTLGSGVQAGRTIALYGQFPSEGTLEMKIEYSRLHTWDLDLMDSSTAWHRIAVLKNIFHAWQILVDSQR